MKILFCSPFLSYFTGHYRRMTVLKAKSMVRAGLDVTIFGFPISFDDINSDERLRYLSIQAGLSDSCRKRLCRLSRSLGRLWLFVFEVGWVQWAALRYARLQGMDVLYLSDVQPWLLLPVIWFTRLRRHRLRLVVFYSSLFDKQSAELAMAYMPWFTRLQIRLNAWAALRLPKMMDVISDCKYSVAPYVNVCPGRVHAIMEGYDSPSPGELDKCQARRELGMSAGTKMLLHFGLASPGKGSNFLLEALQGVPPDFDLYVVGSTLIYSYEDIAHLMPPEWRNHVHFVARYVSEKERIAFFAACDAVVLPYRVGFLGASGNFRDAISFGKLVLVPDQFLMGDLVRKYNLGILFKPEDVTDLRRALVEFSRKSDGWVQGVAERCKTVVEEYSWEKTGVCYRELFEKLIAEGENRKIEIGVSGQTPSRFIPAE